ncbi:Uncharacterised protein [Kingella potus]|uniref:Uncharacterized protein n=1 Tax=Kingella potus TaxID=265175 RepID=A0A377QZD9_9NEIS|nr:hypothetical protein [Kingella potus]UOP01752.1 hypothetical protein LVJ84_06465 [Kingella potus]STQ99938.1 Uncharacterised protein [Kingella potus]
MALTRSEINRRSEEKRGIRQKAFKLEKEIFELFERKNHNPQRLRPSETPPAWRLF